MSLVSILMRPPGLAIYGLRILNHHLAQRLSEALAPQDLTLPQMGILSDVRRIPGISSAGLARFRSLTPQTMSEIITGLEKEGLIERRAHGGRVLRLYLTPAGAAKLHAAISAAATVEKEMLAGLSPKEQDRFRELLFRCVTHLTANDEERVS
jgi:DNA-binding MarR family transcriptional regulator